MIHWWFDDIIRREDLEYLRKFSVGVVGSRFVLNLLCRIGVGCVRYVGDFITPNDVAVDVSLRPHDGNDYDVPSPLLDVDVYSYIYPDDYSEFKRQLRGVDVIIAHRHVEESARVAEEIGAPFIPNIVTTFLPDGVSYFEVEMPNQRIDPISYSLLCSIQVFEILKILTGFEDPVIAPKALLIDPREKGYVREVELRVRRV